MKSSFSKNSKTSISATLRVRYFVMDLLYHNHNPNVRIPSSREIAARFGIARSTARLALEQLSREGYIIGVHGKGTYLNPLQFSSPPKVAPRKIIGIKVGSGDQFLCMRRQWEIMSAQGFALYDRGLFVRLLDNGGSKLEELKTDIELYHLDGIIAWDFPWMDKLAVLGKEFPVVSVSTSLASPPPPAGLDCVVGRNTVYERLKVLLAHRRCQRVFILQARSVIASWKEYLKGIGFQGTVDAFEPLDHNMEAMLDQIFLAEPPDLFILNQEWLPWYVRLVEEHGLDTEKILTLSTSDPEQHTIPYRGMYVRTPYQELAKAAAELLERRMTSPSLPPLVQTSDIVVEQWPPITP